jgi:hypothetical protein
VPRLARCGRDSERLIAASGYRAGRRHRKEAPSIENPPSSSATAHPGEPERDHRVAEAAPSPDPHPIDPGLWFDIASQVAGPGIPDRNPDTYRAYCLYLNPGRVLEVRYDIDGPGAEVSFADIVDGVPVLDEVAWRRYFDRPDADFYVYCLRVLCPPPTRPN